MNFCIGEIFGGVCVMFRFCFGECFGKCIYRIGVGWVDYLKRLIIVGNVDDEFGWWDVSFGDYGKCIEGFCFVDVWVKIVVCWVVWRGLRIVKVLF